MRPTPEQVEAYERDGFLVLERFLDGDEVENSELTPDVLAKQDCVVLLAAPASLDIDNVVTNAPLVFDAQGLTRGLNADNIVRL